GDVRAHFFARAAAGLGSVTLLSLCGGLGQQPDYAISGLCEAVIASPDGSGGQVTQSKSSGSGLKLLLAPWRDRWRPFVAACVQHGLAVPAGLRRAVFTALLQWEHQCCSLLGLLPPLKCLAWWQEYDRLREQVLLAEAQAGGFDAVWVEDVFSWPFAADLLKTLKRPPVAVICNTYNIETVLALRQAGTIAGNAERRLAFRNASQLRRMERQAYAESSLTIVCSEQDRAEGTKLVPAGRFTVVENGVDLQYFQRGC
ncbi:MAG: glycosyltransferase family 4 protein, partial [Planctomyces sp.]